MTHSNSAGTVGPIIFADTTARRQLLQEGEVVTLRKTTRTTGETWWRESRLGPKQGDVLVTEIGTVDPKQEESLAEYRELSGFESVRKWQAAIQKLNGSLPDTGHLYRVVTRE
ncbi:hypothetical protein [Halocatena marina]|uniref:hypothetical protein n=1 Tax=Halocatena marina TaxID=2934937 RepID=UPI00200C766E|nr:hypothetical protein [Halocatena marina]